MKGWSKARLREHKPAIAIIVALLLLWLIATPASASPLTITNVSSGNITETTVTITWTTDELANSTVTYGNSTPPSLLASDSSFVTNHSITLNGLTSSTQYYYEVSSTNSGGNTTTSPGNGTYYTFTTDPYPPTISGISVGNIADTSATITWGTDRLANSTINYGNSTLLGLTAYDSSFVLAHSITLTDLSPAETYYFDVGSTNQYSNTTVDTNGGNFYNFTTMMSAPNISAVSATNITDTSATITWTTDALGNSTVHYGNSTPPSLIASNSTFVTSHSITLTGLTPDTLYYYDVSSSNSEGTTTVSPGNSTYYTFTTAVHLDLQGWGWCTSYGDVASATLVGYATQVERGNGSQSFSVHALGNLTLQVGNATPEIVPVDLYGSRERSLFYLRQEVTGESSTFTGTWITGNDTQFYILTSGLLALPNPEGQSFKTARLCYVVLRTPGGDIPEKQSGGFAADWDVFIAWSTKYADRTITALVGTGVGKIIAEILAKIMILIANIRALGTPYFW
jgi:hypothetical protein